MATRTAAERLRAASDARVRAEIDEAVAIAELAALHAWPVDAPIEMVGARPVRIGADGTLLHDEFLPLEVAAIKGISVTAATWLIRDVVNLKARHPHTWFQMTRGHLPVFRACQLAAEVAQYDLSLSQAQQLDEQLAPKLPGLSWTRALRLARGLIVKIAPERVAALRARAGTQRYVRRHVTDDPLAGFISARIDTADALALDAALDRMADLLARRGNADDRDARRARSLGILAAPERAQELLAGADPDGKERFLPEAKLYVHVAEETLLTGAGPVRVEGIGPLSATMLKQLLGHSRVRITPVVRPYAKVATDSYEIPDQIRDQVILRDAVDVFPWSSRLSRNQDLDHTDPYRRDAPPGAGQTRAANLGPVSRKPHRAKTFCIWQLRQPESGIFHWTSPTGHRYRTDRTGTRRVEHPDPRVQELNELLWNQENRDQHGDGETPDDDP